MDKSDNKEKKNRTSAVFTPYTKTELTPEQLAMIGKNIEILKHIMARKRTPANWPKAFPIHSLLRELNHRHKGEI